MRRFFVKVMNDQFRTVKTDSFNSAAEAEEYAIKETMSGYRAEVRDNATGKQIKGFWSCW